MKTSSSPKVTIQNVVATARFNQRFDLNAITRAFPHVEYRPERFPGLVFRLEKPKTATLIFTSGRMVCTGAKSEGEARKAISKVARELWKAGVILHEKPEITIQNIVASMDLGDVVVDLEEIVNASPNLGGRVMYEPEQFPGLIYRMIDPKVVFLIFTSGKMVCVGAKKEVSIYRTVGNLVTLLDENKLIMPRSERLKAVLNPLEEKQKIEEAEKDE